MDGDFGFTTRILHADRLGRPEHGSLHKPIHTSIAYGYERAEDLAAVFQNRAKGYAYARQANPTVAALEEKITSMEKGVGSICFSTGMAALAGLWQALLRRGDHIVSSAFLFGNTSSQLHTMKALGLEVDFVDATSVKEMEKALRPQTKMVLVETIANPVTQVADLKAIGDLCAARRIIYVVDNTMTPPCLFRPAEAGAAFSVHSLSKYVGGHGNVLAGSVTDTGRFDWTGFAGIYDIYKNQDPKRWALVQLRKKGLRDFGAALAPEAAHSVSVGAETLALRMERACDNAARLAGFLEAHPKVKRVNYPGLGSHPQQALAKSLFKRPGALLSFELEAGLDCFAFLNRLKLVILSSNLGDTRTLAIPVAHTIFYEMGPERRAGMGIDDSLIRVSVGIEDAEDLLGDFERALG